METNGSSRSSGSDEDKTTGGGGGGKQQQRGGRRKGVKFNNGGGHVNSNNVNGNVHKSVLPSASVESSPALQVVGNGGATNGASAGAAGDEFSSGGGSDDDEFKRGILNNKSTVPPDVEEPRVIVDNNYKVTNTSSTGGYSNDNGSSLIDFGANYVDKDGGGAGARDAYNEYVNYLYLEKNSRSDSLKEDDQTYFPKSIVKSPSASNFQTVQKKSSLNLKPRLSLQSPGNEKVLNVENEEDRPVLHVQFVGSEDKESGPTETDPLTSATHHCTNSCESNCSKKSVCCSSNSFVSFSESESSGSSSSSSSSSSGSSSNESSSLEQYAEARPPDGGWGWVVVFAAFMINLFADGITFSFGVIYVEFLNYFGEGKAKTAWIGSLFMAMPLLSGPIASFLTDRYGCRNVTVAGSIMASTGFFLSAFAESMEMLYFTFGILSGFGLSLCYVAAVVIVAYYFDKKRSFATGLSVCGSGIGTFLFAPLLQFWIAEYGWRGSVLILSGVFLNMCVCGLLMRDLEWTTYRAKSKRMKDEKEKSKKQNTISADSFSVSNSTNTAGTNVWKNEERQDDHNERQRLTEDEPPQSDPRLFNSLIMLPTFLENGEKVPHEVLELLSKHRNFVMMNNYSGLMHSRSFSEPITNELSEDVIKEEENEDENYTNNEDKPKTKDKKSKAENEKTFMEIIQRNQNRRHRHHHSLKHNRNDRLAKPSAAYLNDLRMHRHSLTYRGAMLNINRYRLRASSCPDIYRNSMTTIAKEKSYWYQGVKEFKNLFADILDFSHFTNIRFTLFAISNLLLYTWYDVPYVYIADYAISLDVTETNASMLLSVIGIVNMFGEILLGWVGDLKKINVTLVYALCMIICGGIVALVPLFQELQAMLVISGLFGFFIAGNYSLTSIILVQLISLDRFTNAYGLLLLVQGIANLIGPPLAGYIRDVTGDYSLSFYAAGVFITISGLLLLILPAIERYKKCVSLLRKKADLVRQEEALNGGKKGLGNGKVAAECV